MIIRVLAFVEQQLCLAFSGQASIRLRAISFVVQDSIQLDPMFLKGDRARSEGWRRPGWLGSTLEDMLDLKGAAESFGKVIELDPKHDFPRKMLECTLTAMDDL